MFFKTVVASIIAALLAGGVVYFGMPADSVGAGSVNIRSSAQATPPDTREAPQNAPQSVPQQQAIPQQEERWVDKFVTNPLRRTLRPEPEEPPRGLQKSNPKTWAKSDGTADNAPISAPDQGAQNDRKNNPRENTRQKAKPESDAPRYYVLENGELSEIDVLPGPTASDADNPNASFRILTVSTQAKQIKQADLRDRAFLDIVDYALSEELYSASISAMEEIEQVELRDTARSRIAIAYAKMGDNQAAFGLIDDVEVDGLRDVLRLQVIEAIILPERLPDGL